MHNFHDVANAFGSVDHDHFKHALPRLVLPEDTVIAKDCFTQASICVNTVDAGIIDFVPTEGGLQGHPMIVELFNEAYAPAVANWQLDLFTDDPVVAAMTHCKAPNGEITDLSLGLFIDDIGKTQPVLTQAEDVARTTRFSTAVLDLSMDEHTGAKQNADKLVTVPCLFGPESTTQTWRLFSEYVSLVGQLAKWAR